MNELPEVRIGQVWADNDKRANGRHVRIVGWCDFPPGQTSSPRKALVALCEPDGEVIRVNGKGKTSRIRIDRFRPTTTGYRLVRDCTNPAKAFPEIGDMR